MLRLAGAIVAITASAAVTLTSRDARAFCRMMTQQSPPGYDPTSKGCWSGGMPVAWTAGNVGYHVAANASQQVTLSQATRAAHEAFDAWNRAPCSAGAPTVQFEDQGPAEASAAFANDAATSAVDAGTFPNTIVFDDTSWPADLDSSTLALTTVSFTAHSGEIFQARIEINSQDHVLWAGEPGAAGEPDGAYDLRVILTHEAGHFAGLAHATNLHAVMYALYQPEASSLTQDDVDGICSVYPPPGSGCACKIAGGGAREHSLVYVLPVAGLLAARTWRRVQRRLSPAHR